MDIKIVNDLIVNNWLWLKGWLRYKTKWSIFSSKDILKIIDERNYKLKTNDNFKSLRNWSHGMWWGSAHPDQTNQYTNPKNTKITKDGLELSVNKNPKIFFKNKTYVYGYGVVEHKKSFFHGYFEVKCTCFPGIEVWHAPLWFVSTGDRSQSEFSVLPEIDVCEVYSGEKGEKMHGETNVHYGKSYKKGESKSMGSKQHTYGSIDNKAIRYGMLWEPNKITIYYDGQKVRQITQDRIIKRFDREIMPIIGCGVKETKTANETNKILIEYFKYYKN